MDVTIRNIDEEAYQRLQNWAALQGIGIGEALSRLVFEHAHLPGEGRRKSSIWSLKPWDWGPGTERTSEEIDKIVYDDLQ